MIEDSKCFWEFTCIDSGTVFGTTFKKRGVVMGYHGRRDTTCAFWPVRTLSKWHKFTSTEPCTYIQSYKREPKSPQNGTSFANTVKVKNPCEYHSTCIQLSIH